jgi:hypothetical protein
MRALDGALAECQVATKAGLDEALAKLLAGPARPRPDLARSSSADSEDMSAVRPPLAADR